MGVMMLASLTLALAFQSLAPVELVETMPVETTLEHADIPDAHIVWLEMIGGARTSIDLAHFYASNQQGSRLETVVAALEAAAVRGVKVRFLAEEKFVKTYPETLERLGMAVGISVRRFDVAKAFGGVLHSKSMVVDGREAFVGSQNFDWRALEHIVELGLRVRAPQSVRAFAAIFECDWQVAGGTPLAEALAPLRTMPAPVDEIDGVRIETRFSPLVGIPGEPWWDLPELVERIDAASKTLQLQLLTYKMVGRDKEYFAELETALRRAAARGVAVRILVADWGKRRGIVEGLQSLEPLENIAVRFVTIPEHSSGHIPFGRVLHAKTLVADGARLWLGTSNWERDYFHESRNASVFIDGGALPTRVGALHEELWTSAYASAVDPAAKYIAPRYGER
ncbi:MAG: phospholipase [Planctomycetes bacterium]|nr:phospholipase [Planctomycetota bacterium]